MKRSKPGSKRGKKAFAVSIQAEARDFAEVVNLIPLGNALLRVPAVSPREKKKMLALRPWRPLLPGVGSARSAPMKNNDDIPTTDTTEINQLINRVKRGDLAQGDAQLIEKLLNILLRIVSLLQRKHTSIRRMKELLFGMKEKKRGEDEAKNRAEESRSAAEETSQTDSTKEMSSKGSVAKIHWTHKILWQVPLHSYEGVRKFVYTNFLTPSTNLTCI